MPFLVFPQDELYPTVELTTPIEELSWVRGRPLDETIPELVFELDGKRSFVWPDFIRPGPNIPLVSPKLRAALERSGVDNIEYFPARVVDRSTREQRPYFGANIIGLVRALDREQSEFMPYDDNPDVALTIDRLVVDTTQFDGMRLFRLAEFDLLIVVDDALKAELEQQAVTGIDFVAPEDWDGFRT